MVTAPVFLPEKGVQATERRIDLSDVNACHTVNWDPKLKSRVRSGRVVELIRLDSTQSDFCDCFKLLVDALGWNPASNSEADETQFARGRYLVWMHMC